MQITVSLALVAAAFIMTAMSADGRCPLWIPVLLIVVVQLLALLPPGRAL